jgi:hypothetical protein
VVKEKEDPFADTVKKDDPFAEEGDIGKKDDVFDNTIKSDN